MKRKTGPQMELPRSFRRAKTHRVRGLDRGDEPAMMYYEQTEFQIRGSYVGLDGYGVKRL